MPNIGGSYPLQNEPSAEECLNNINSQQAIDTHENEETTTKNNNDTTSSSFYDGYKSLIRQIETHRTSICADETQNSNQYYKKRNQLCQNSPNNYQNQQQQPDFEISVEEDLACDLEVASFFDHKKLQHVVVGNETDLEDDYFSSNAYDGGEDDAGVNYNLDYDDYDDVVGAAGEDEDLGQIENDRDNVYNDDEEEEEEEDSQNLDFLVRQLVAEASLSNLNLNMDNTSKHNQVKEKIVE